MTGERITHPDADPEAYDLLILADGPWDEARMRVADARVVQARHWIEFARLLKEPATADLDARGEELDEWSWSLSNKNPQSREVHERSRIAKARQRLKEAREQQAEIRAVLLLDDPQADEESP